MKSTLDQEKVKALFASCPSGFDIIIGLYKLALSKWDKIEYIIDAKPCMERKAGAIFLIYLGNSTRNTQDKKFSWVAFG